MSLSRLRVRRNCNSVILVVNLFVAFVFSGFCTLSVFGVGRSLVLSIPFQGFPKGSTDLKEAHRRVHPAWIGRTKPTDMTSIVPVDLAQSDWLPFSTPFHSYFDSNEMSDKSMPIKTSTGRRLVISNVSDTASFSARRLSFNAKELDVGKSRCFSAVVYSK